MNERDVSKYKKDAGPKGQHLAFYYFISDYLSRTLVLIQT